MGKVTITYSKIKDAAKEAQSAANYYEDFSSELSNKVYNKLSIGYGSDSRGYISSARNTVYNKVKDLNSKKKKYSDLSKSLYDLKERVQGYETSAKNAVTRIATDELELKNRKWYQKVGDWIYGTVCVDLLNSNPLTRGLGNLIKSGLDYVEYGFNKTIDWFKHGNGKYYLNIAMSVLGDIAAIAGTIGAIALCAGATVATGGAATPLLVAAIASGVGTVMTVVDSGFSIYNNVKALKISHDSNDPGRARYYGNISGVNSAIGKYDMGGKKANKIWNGIGIGYDITHTAANITAFVAGSVGAAGLKETIVHDKITGAKKVEVVYDKSIVKGNMKKVFAEKVGFTKRSGEWKFDKKFAFSKGSRKTGTLGAQSLATKHATQHGISKVLGKNALEGPGRITNLNKSIKINKAINSVKKHVSTPISIVSNTRNIEKILNTRQHTGDMYKNTFKPFVSVISGSKVNITSPIGDIDKTVIPIIDTVLKLAQ